MQSFLLRSDCFHTVRVGCLKLEITNFTCKMFVKVSLLNLDDSRLLLLADRQLVAANVDLDRVAQRCDLTT